MSHLSDALSKLVQLRVLQAGVAARRFLLFFGKIAILTPFG